MLLQVKAVLESLFHASGARIALQEPTKTPLIAGKMGMGDFPVLPRLLMLCLALGSLSSPKPLLAQQQGITFLISPNQNLSGSVECPVISFQSRDGSIWTAWIKNDRIVTSPQGNIFAGHSENALDYVDHDGKPLSARFEGGKLILTRKGETKPCSTTDILDFKSWNGSPLSPGSCSPHQQSRSRRFPPVPPMLARGLPLPMGK